MTDDKTPDALRAIADAMENHETYRTDWLGVEALFLQNTANEIELLRAALKFYSCGCGPGVCAITKPKFKGIRCGLTAQKALSGEWTDELKKAYGHD